VDVLTLCFAGRRSYPFRKHLSPFPTHTKDAWNILGGCSQGGEEGRNFTEAGDRERVSDSLKKS